MTRAKIKLQLGSICDTVWQKKEDLTWDIKVVEEDSTEAREKCIKQLAQNVRRNVKFHSNRAETVRYTAGNAFQSVKAKAVKSS